MIVITEKEYLADMKNWSNRLIIHIFRLATAYIQKKRKNIYSALRLALS